MNSQLADKIRKTGSPGVFLSREEKDYVLELVYELAQQEGLGAALTCLWEQQKAIGFVLGDPTITNDASDKSRFLGRRIGRYWLMHSESRKDRKNIAFLKSRKILSDAPEFVYERLTGKCYKHSKSKSEGFDEPCFLCSAETANPNEILVRIKFGNCGFVYGANYATLGHSHFTLWTEWKEPEEPLLQNYKPKDTLFWLCEHGKKLRSSEFATFFNGLGAGNSIRHFHYQTLRESLPIFDAESMWVRRDIARMKWPMPAYSITLKGQCERSDVLSIFDSFILRWQDIDKERNTLNLLHRTDANGFTHIIFVPRVNCEGKRKSPGISNELGGCEVGGRINIEKLDEWLNATKKTAEEVEAMLAAIAPEGDKINYLESFLMD
jgi:hypothetical protein